MVDGANTVSFLTATLWIAVGAVVAAFVAGRAARFVKISEHRQNWINALRDDIATYIVRAHTIHADTQSLLSMSPALTQYQEIQRRLADNTSDADTLLNKIILRLNPTEQPHIMLQTLLRELRDTKANIGLEDRAIEQARCVLKREWDVVKYGELVDLRLWLKARWRKALTA